MKRQHKESERSKQPDALRLAERADYWSGIYPLGCETAIELRRLHEALQATTAERDEQCRLNGMGSEREALLLGKVARQRKALEQALDVLKGIPTADSDCDEQTQREDDAIQEAITAIQEQLK